MKLCQIFKKYFQVFQNNYKIRQIKKFYQMLNLNVQVGINPLHKHKPIYFKTYEQIDLSYSYTIGEDGQIVAWKKIITTPQLLNNNHDFQTSVYSPVYYMIPSINGDHQKCLALILTQIRLINRQEKTFKIVTYHADNRFRIWQACDGKCINISSHNFFSQKIIGICENTVLQTRFLFAFSQNYIFVIDCWSMSVIGKLEPKKEVYSQFLKGRINQKRQLELYDNYHKSYRLDVSKIFKQNFIDIGRTINSFQKSQNQLKETLLSLQEEKLVLFHKTWKTEDYKTPLKDIIVSQKNIIKKQLQFGHFFDEKLLIKFPELLSQNQLGISVTVENLFFIKGTELWYFVGTDDGKVIGFPVIQDTLDKYFMVKDQSNLIPQIKNPVKFLSLIDNLLICSWQNGNFRVYTTDNLDYVAEQEMTKNKRQNSMQETSFYKIQLQKLCVSKQKFSSSIKHILPIYILPSNLGSSAKISSHEAAFQLQNNEVIIFDSLNNKIYHYVGIEQNIKIYLVVYMGESSQYVGVGTQNGIEVFNPQGYERTISLKSWDWKEWNLVSKYESKNDFNTFKSNNAKGLGLIQFSNRNTINQLQYTHSFSAILEQTFGPIETQNFTNDTYLKFYFRQKPSAQKSLHSRSIQNYIATLKHKHNSYHRDISNNISFFINSSLNKQLDAYSSKASHDSIQSIIFQNYIFYSTFLWDVFQIPFLTPLIKKVSKNFALKRRYATQGIGKTLTLYFDLEECIFGLSKQILTEYAIATISFMQCYVLKQIQKTDDLVSVVEYFTLNSSHLPKICISGQILSRSIISSNQNIVKACINLLISTIIARNLNIHPLYQYFVLNLKNMEEQKESNQSSILPLHSAIKSSSTAMSSIFPGNSKNIVIQNNKELSEIECEWMLYLGLGLIYGKRNIQKQQIKMFLNRIIECIQLSNFFKKPDLVQVILKLLNEGLSQTWREFMNKQIVTKLYLDLFKIFFYYDGIGVISPEDKKFNFCFENNSSQHIKRMKQSLIKTIVFLSKQFNNEFIQCLTAESVNQKLHPAYPSSVIEILRQYLKSEKPTSYLVFYIELLLQCLSPMTPNLRKFVQKNVITTLQLMCTYKSVSFNQNSQKLSIKSNNHLYIYCLRTSTKWRTISLLKEEGKQEIQGVKDEDCVLEMSPKGNYIALMTYKRLYLWRLNSGFWSGLLGAFSQRQSYELPKGRNQNIVWDQDENSITVVNENPSLNKAYRI